jgi:hypothetical protein
VATAEVIKMWTMTRSKETKSDAVELGHVEIGR